jgi:Pyruvate/2-oxoacid:ferredoxin oxidoreductase delta subunit
VASITVQANGHYKVERYAFTIVECLRCLQCWAVRTCDDAEIERAIEAHDALHRPQDIGAEGAGETEGEKR